jgi:hypothetical protein
MAKGGDTVQVNGMWGKREKGGCNGRGEGWGRDTSRLKGRNYVLICCPLDGHLFTTWALLGYPFKQNYLQIETGMPWASDTRHNDYSQKRAVSLTTAGLTALFLRTLFLSLKKYRHNPLPFGGESRPYLSERARGRSRK